MNASVNTAAGFRGGTGSGDIERRSTGTGTGRAASRGESRGTRFRATALSEWIKFRSVRSGPAVLIGAGVLMLFGAWFVSAGYHSGWANNSAAEKAAFDPGDITLRGVEFAQLLIGALGVITVTGEYTSGLIRGTFIATPQRAQVLAMKALIFGAVAWVCCTVLSFAAFFVGRIFMTAPMPQVSLGSPGVAIAVVGGGLYLTTVGLFAMAVGVLMRRTAAALAVLFGVTLVAPVVVSMLPGKAGSLLNEYLPAGAGAQIWHVYHGAPYMLGRWQGFAVFVAFTAATAALAFVQIRRRDV